MFKTLTLWLLWLFYNILLIKPLFYLWLFYNILLLKSLFYFILWFKVFYIIDPFLFCFIVWSLYGYCEPQRKPITPFNLWIYEVIFFYAMIDLLEALSIVITCLFLRTVFSMIGLLGACDFPHCCLRFIFCSISLWVDSVFSSGCMHRMFTIYLACLISMGLSLVHSRGDLCDSFTLTIWFHFFYC